MNLGPISCSHLRYLINQVAVESHGWNLFTFGPLLVFLCSTRLDVEDGDKLRCNLFFTPFELLIYVSCVLIEYIVAKWRENVSRCYPEMPNVCDDLPLNEHYLNENGIFNDVLCRKIMAWMHVFVSKRYIFWSW